MHNDFHIHNGVFWEWKLFMFYIHFTCSLKIILHRIFGLPECWLWVTTCGQMHNCQFVASYWHLKKVPDFEVFYIPKFLIKDIHSKFIFSHKINSFLIKLGSWCILQISPMVKQVEESIVLNTRQINTAKVVISTIVCCHCFWSTCS